MKNKLAVTAVALVMAASQASASWVQFIEAPEDGESGISGPPTITWSADWGFGWVQHTSGEVPGNSIGSSEFLGYLPGVTGDYVSKTFYLMEPNGVDLSDVVIVSWGGQSLITVSLMSDNDTLRGNWWVPPGPNDAIVLEQPGVMVFGANDGMPFEVRIQSEPVPEPTTMITGALLLLPFGAGKLRRLRGRPSPKD